MQARTGAQINGSSAGCKVGAHTLLQTYRMHHTFYSTHTNGQQTLYATAASHIASTTVAVIRRYLAFAATPAASNTSTR